MSLRDSSSGTRQPINDLGRTETITNTFTMRQHFFDSHRQKHQKHFDASREGWRASDFGTNVSRLNS